MFELLIVIDNKIIKDKIFYMVINIVGVTDKNLSINARVLEIVEKIYFLKIFR